MPQASETKKAYSWRTPRSLGFTGSVGKMFTLGTVPLRGLAVWRPSRMACDNCAMASVPMKITLREPGVAGSYELVERRGDGSLLLRPEHERLSDVLRETDGQVFRDEEFAAHLERVAASEDDLPADPPA